MAHELDGEVEDGEHGTGATRVALIVELQSAGECLAPDQPQDEEAEQRDQQQRGQPLAGARAVELEAQGRSVRISSRGRLGGSARVTVLHFSRR